jgi:rare lipoprotein A
MIVKHFALSVNELSSTFGRIYEPSLTYFITKHAVMKSIANIFILNILFVTGLFSQGEEFGLASYYSDLFHGKPTASGELYDKAKLTCAHKTLPFGTMVKVTRLDNNKSVQVRVTDRGPFISGRVVELSKAAAERIDLVKDGSARVKIEVVGEKGKDDVATVASPAEKPKSYEETTPAVKSESETTSAAKPETTTEKPKANKPATTKPEEKTTTTEKIAINKKPEATPKETTAKGQPASTSSAVLVKSADYQTYDLFQIELKRPEKKGFGVQVAALASQDALFKKLADLQGDWFSTILVSVQTGKKNEMLYKVVLGTFETEAEANIYKANLKKNKKIDGFVVDLSTLNKD